MPNNNNSQLNLNNFVVKPKLPAKIRADMQEGGELPSNPTCHQTDLLSTRQKQLTIINIDSHNRLQTTTKNKLIVNQGTMNRNSAIATKKHITPIQCINIDEQDQQTIETKKKKNQVSTVVGEGKTQTSSEQFVFEDKCQASYGHIRQPKYIGEPKYIGQPKQNSTPTTILNRPPCPIYIRGSASIPVYVPIEDRCQYGLAKNGAAYQFYVNQGSYESQYKIHVIIEGNLNFIVEEIKEIGVWRGERQNKGSKTQFDRTQVVGSTTSQQRDIPIVVISYSRYVNSTQSSFQLPYIILNPTHQLAPTNIFNSSTSCRRRDILRTYLESKGPPEKLMVYGIAVGKYLELLGKDGINHSVQEAARNIYNELLFDMYQTQITPEELLEKCVPAMNNLKEWFRVFFVQKRPLQRGKLIIILEACLGCEVRLRSRHFGLKGNVDCLFKGRSQTGQAVIVPFELKSSIFGTNQKVKKYQQNQLDTYCILASEIYQMPAIGILYLAAPNITELRPLSPEVTYQIINEFRNVYVSDLAKLYASPLLNLPNLAPKFNCRYCHVAKACYVLSGRGCKNKVDFKQSTATTQQQQQLLQTENTNTSIADIQDGPNDALVGDTLSSLTPIQQAYIVRWLRLLHLEDVQQKSDFDRRLAKDFGCFYVQHSQLEQKLLNNSEKRVLTLKKSFKKETDAIEVMRCYKVTQTIRITIQSIEMNERVKITKVLRQGLNIVLGVQFVRFKIDYDESSLDFQKYLGNQRQQVDLQVYPPQFIKQNRATLLQMLQQPNWLNKLIIQCKTPLNNEPQDQLAQTALILSDPTMVGRLKDNQVNALIKAVTCERYCLVGGMPGTGKTQLIVRLISAFSRLGKKVLVTGFTNNSVDNILQRVIAEQTILCSEMIRQGSRTAQNQQRNSQLSPLAQRFTTIGEYKKYFIRKKIWFVTLSSLNRPHIPSDFDVAIVDEASQCIEPSCLAALVKATKFILIGDYRQLQPVIASQQAKKEGMAVSLFQRLCQNVKNPTMVALTQQYRMSRPIMELANTLVYDGLLTSNEETASRKLSLKEGWKETATSKLHHILEPQQSICFCDSDSLSEHIPKTNLKVQTLREFQSSLAATLYLQFISLGVLEKDIAIITAYNATVERIRKLLYNRMNQHGARPCVLTIDKSQGIDKEVLILVIQGRETDIGGSVGMESSTSKPTIANDLIVADPRRLNVAITRSRSKLLIISSGQFVKSLQMAPGRTLGMALDSWRMPVSSQLYQYVTKQNSPFIEKDRQVRGHNSIEPTQPANNQLVRPINCIPTQQYVSQQSLL